LASILLAVVFMLPFLLPLLASGESADARLPICCRANGKHHCMLGMLPGGGSDGAKPTLSTVQGRCPFCPAVPAAFHPPFSTVLSESADLVSFTSHPACVAQAEARYRISFDRSRQKRGPPCLNLSLS